MNKMLLMIILLSVKGYAQTVEGIPTDRMPAVNIDSFKISQLVTAIDNGTYPNIHSLLITRHGKLVFEKYWPGADEIWGDGIGVVKHAKDSVHDIRSISKSIVSACIGIAIKQGKIKSVQQRVFDFFPEYKQYDTGWKSLLTIEHLLTMTSGLRWNEEVPYDNPDNSEIRMVRSPNPIEYVLMQPMDVAPGKLWKYNGGTTQLLAAIIQKVSGQPIEKFAANYLYKPLGITKYVWLKYPKTNMAAAASGVRLRSRDLLKFGLLYYHKGVWNKKQILPASWVEASFKSYVKRDDGGYGYQFWLFADERQRPIIAAVGNGDQRIIFYPHADLLVVVTAGNYNKWDIPNNSGTMMKEYIVPAVIRD